MHSGPFFLALSDAEGKAIPARANFMSSTLTPTGFPIQGGGRPTVGAWEPLVEVHDLHYVELGLIEGRLEARFQIPETFPAGVYRPILWVEPENVPAGQDWIAANVVRNTYWQNEAALPPIESGSVPSDTRVIWRLMMDDFVLGTHGAPTHGRTKRCMRCRRRSSPRGRCSSFLRSTSRQGSRSSTGSSRSCR